jgi:general secretion pathway protein C
LAIIEDGSPTKTKIVQIGNMIKPDAELVAIWAEEAWIKRSDGRIERIKNKGDGRGSKKSKGRYKAGATTTTTSGKGKAASSDAEKFKKGIIRKDSNSYQITRGLIEEQLADLNKLGTQARIIPHYKDGKANGFKLVGIRPGSLYSHIGIRSGDVIRGVNGSEINSPTKALQAFEKFKSESELDLEITRRGQKKVIHYKITD